VPVGDAMFWFIGRDPAQGLRDQPYFYLVDESSKLNLNAPWVTATILSYLPRMTPDLAVNIVTWKGMTDNSGLTADPPATDDVYAQLFPPYHLKGGPFESVDELRLVDGATLDILYGEDANLNGVLDSTEPEDMPNGMLDSGILDYFTVSSRDSIFGVDVTNKVLVTDQAGLTSLMEQVLGGSRADEISNTLFRASAVITTVVGGGGGGGGGGGAGGTTSSVTFSNLLDFYIKSGMTEQEFAEIEPDITMSTTTNTIGLVNVNTAPGAVLACTLLAAFPSTDFNTLTNYASELVAYRETNPDSLNSFVWVLDVLGTNSSVVALGNYITGLSYQWTADVAAVGHNGRGYRRVKFTYDYSEGGPRIIYRQDLTHLGWALGSEVRRNLELAKQTR